jgi:CCR4-NOT transcription complex subunit 7/8
LVLNEDVNWISFHGLYDFAYLLKAMSGLCLPETEAEFFENLKIYFPNVYDVRYLVRNIEMFRCSLSKLAEELRVVRIGMQHQAGSDSYVTSKVFYNLSFEFLTEEEIEVSRGVLYGIGKGAEDWSNFYNGASFNKNSNQKTNYTYENTQQQVYSMNPLNMQYFNNNVRNNNINGYVGYNNYNLPIQGNISNINNMNYQPQHEYITMQNGYDNNINMYQQNLITTNSKKGTPIKPNVIKA